MPGPRKSTVKRQKRRSYNRRAHLKTRYGMTLEFFLEQEAKGCPICGFPKKPRNKNFHVDHNHKNDRIRGVICSRCNMGLAKFGDNAARLRAAADYLDTDGVIEPPIYMPKED